MRAFEILAERKIREAMNEGEFDNLPGKGRPIDMSENPFEDPSSRVAHRLLRNNGYTLPWIEESKEITTAIDAARAALRDARLRTERSTDPAAPARWRSAVAVFRIRAAEINRRVLNFNVTAPARSVELLTLNVDAEVERAIAAAASAAGPDDGRESPATRARGTKGEPQKPVRIWQALLRWLRLAV